jgi:phosphatidylserine/phosphatidylglycerophosphate/cardiolipin synthase-like enzyme
LFCYVSSIAQSPLIKCYFNHPVNTSISSGTNAVYLNGSFADTVAAYINRAKYTVDIAQYDYTSTASGQLAVIATAANNAQARGVIVRWIYDGSSTNSGLSLLNASIKTLGSPTTSNYGIMHDKFMIVDVNSPDSTNTIVMTGSQDWSAEQTNSDYNNILFIQSKSIALAYYREFNKMWGGTGASPNAGTETFGPYKSISSQNIFNINGTKVELYFSPEDTVGKRLQNTVNSADYELFFGIYTFTDTTIANLIKTKYNAGISVKGIMDQYSLSYIPYTTLNPVLGNNMKIYTGSYIYHNKIMLADASYPSSDPQVFTGSFNWSSSAEKYNDENAIIIHDASIANQYEQSLCQNFTDLGGTACTGAVTYTFNGNGNWNLSSNWVNNTPPPATLSVGSQIIIDPISNGQCVLNIPYTLSQGAIITVNQTKKFVVAGSLTIQQ